MMDALSPNTAAFLSYLGGDDDSTTFANAMSNSNTNNNQNQNNLNNNAILNSIFPNQQLNMNAIANDLAAKQRNPTSLPPSAFFNVPAPIPGRDTPEFTPPSEQSVSPVDIKPPFSGANISDSDEEPTSAHKTDADPKHKRKATGGETRQLVEEDDEEDSDSDDPSGHEDKKQHKKGGRKSIGEDGKPPKENKAARRKEQNRAAQKAFRERREAKVKDLETKVAELEATSYGAQIENENLRGILKRLQEENVNLKQSAFTFAMPIGSSSTSPVSVNNAMPKQAQRVPSKPPTPPYTAPSYNDDTLRSINDPQPPLKHHSSSGAVSSLAEVSPAPESISSVGSTSSAKNLFTGNSPLQFDSFSNFSRSDTGITPPSVGNDNKSEVDALWASFYPNGFQSLGNNAANNQNANSNGNGNVNLNPNLNPNVNGNINTNLNGFVQQSPAQQAAANPWNAFSNGQSFLGNKAVTSMAYRDTNVANQFNPQPPVQPAAQPTGTTDWANLTGDAVGDFLASLNGANNNSTTEEPSSGVDDDFFNAQLQQILSGSNSFALPSSNQFSPTNYLNMSPSPLNSLSNSASPQSLQPGSSATSPESTCSSAPKELANNSISVTMPTAVVKDHNTGVVNVVDENGKILKPSDLWVRMGMQHTNNVDAVMIDDLCDQMKEKARCGDGPPQLTIDDMRQMLRHDNDAFTVTKRQAAIPSGTVNLMPSRT